MNPSNPQASAARLLPAGTSSPGAPRSGVLIWGPRGDIRFSNAAAQAILGLPAEQLHGQTVRDLLAHAVYEDGSPIPDAEHTSVDVLYEGQSIAGQVIGVLPPGTTDRIWLQGGVDPEIDAAGRVCRVVYSFVDITAYRRAEDIFSKAFQASPNAAGITRRHDGRIVDVNESWLRTFGYERAEVIGRTLAEIGVQPDPARLAQVVSRLNVGESVGEFELQFRTRTGQVREFALSHAFIEIAGEACLLTIGRDITEAKQAAAALRRSQERFAQIFRASPDAISLTRLADSRVIDVNDAWLRWFGYRREEVVGHTVPEVNRWRDPADRAHLLQRLAEQGAVRDVEFPVRTKTGEERWCLSSIETIELDGEPHLLGTARDITEQKAAEAALRASEARFAKVFRASPDAIVITRLADGQVIDANDSWCALTGYSRGEAARLGTTRATLWADPAQWDALYHAARSEGAVRDFDLTFRTKAGEIRQGTLSADIIHIEGEDCLLSIVRDTTVRKRMEEQMRATERLTALGRLAAGVAHEFNNILAGIMGRVDLLALNAEDPEVAATLRLLQQAVDDGAAVVRRVQAYARLTAPGEFRPLAVADLVNDVTTLTQAHWQVSAAGGGGITLRTQIEQGLAVQGNATELREVLTNLILNAVDALPQGGRIFVGAAARSGNVVISVRDTGVGMDTATQERIFEPFFTTKATGSGLGLVVVKDIVQRHGGEIAVVSNVGGGTLFTITLPAATEAPALPLAQAPPVPATPARILAVDDDPGLGQLLQSMLAVGGHDVIVATSGPEALALLERVPFDLICTDLGMPGMNGWEVARQVRARAPGLPVVLITGWGVHLDPAELAAHTVDFVLPKPYRVAQVQEVVAQALALPHKEG